MSYSSPWMGDPMNGGTLSPIQSMDMEVDKDKGKRPIYDSQAGKSGEGTSGIVKKILEKEGN